MPENTSPLIQAREKGGHWWLTGFGLVFILISAPATWAIPDELNKGNYAILIALLFPLVGLFMLRWAYRMWRSWAYFGPLPVSLNPYPGAQSGDVAGALPCPYPDALDQPPHFTLQCVRREVRGSGKERKTSERILWQDRQQAYLDQRSTPPRLRFQFSLDGSQPVSQTFSRSDQILWRLVLEGTWPQQTLTRTYEIPVEAGQARTHEPLPERFVTQREQRERTEALERVAAHVQLEQTGDGIELFSPGGRHRGMHLLLMLFGLVFAGAGAFLFRQAATEGAMLYLMSAVFLLVGVGILLGGLYSAGASLRAHVRQGQVEIIRYWGGRALFRRQTALDDAQALHIVSRGSMTQGHKHTEFYALEVKTDGKQLRIAEGLEGRDEAEALRDTLIKLLRLPG
ncbi:MAG: hypothetical protein LPK85_06585 [Gammaproteobacteria bacterium]|nr:hypothetical protein [Gammaproteobacteria bacterium]